MSNNKYKEFFENLFWGFIFFFVFVTCVNGCTKACEINRNTEILKKQTDELAK